MDLTAENLLLQLNDAQREAVEHGEGPLLVLAGAGSGKTRVLTHRIAHLVATEQALAHEILAITFTNKAADEMRMRVERLVGDRSRQMVLKTFHATSARILRVEAERLGYTSRFTIYDGDDSLRLIRRCLSELDVDPKRFVPRALRAQISEAKTQLLDAAAYGERVGGFFEQTVASVYELYERQLHANNALDFDDLLLRTVDLFRLDEALLARYRRNFRWILVDEYQDTNHAQYVLLRLLAGQQRNLSVVGDDDQSIYRFRGADVRNILEFESDYPDARVVKLEQNYRSTQNILTAANAVVACNRERKAKRLWTDIGGGDPIKVVELDDEHGEARYVANEIAALAEDGASYSEIAVFYRTNAQSRVLEDILVRYDMAYQVIGGTKFYERAEIKDVISYLALVVNPLDLQAFRRIVNTPRRGIGNTTVARLIAHANTIGESARTVIDRAETVPGLGRAAIRAVAEFAETIGAIEGAHRDGATVRELLEITLSESGYMDALNAQGTIEAEGRCENLGELLGVAEEFERAGGGGLEEFLQQTSLLSDADTIDDDRSKITLMTVHNAKGLEYPTVFVIGCEEGVFPHSRAIDQGDLEEERRLCYVGITRARERLYLTHTRSRNLFGQRSYNLPSRFLAEIPSSVVAGDGEDWLASEHQNGRHDLVNGAETGQITPLRVGDDVVHANFGEGVVLAVERGGVVVVRFAQDGSERSLVRDFAPLQKL